MKKTLGITLSLAAVVSVFTGCGSTKISLHDSSPIAIISIIGNTQIPWVDEESEFTTATGEPEAENFLTSMANRITDSQNPEILTAVDRLDYAYDSANINLLELAGCTVIPKEELLASEAYTYIRPSYFNMFSATKTATGFKDLVMIGSKNARYLMEETGAKSILAMSLTFQKELTRGTKSNGIVAGVVTMKARFLNNRGNEVLNKLFVAKTSEPIKIINGQYNKDTLVEEVNEAIDDVIRQFCMELSKMSSDVEILPEETESEIQGTPIKMKKAE